MGDPDPLPAPVRPAPPPRLAAVATALPPHVCAQADIRRFAQALLESSLGPDERRLFTVFESTGIERRHFAMPLEWFTSPRGFGESNACFVARALELAEEVVAKVLARAHVPPTAIDHVVFVCSTGLATPSLEARLVPRAGLRSDVQRTPLWGLGCAGGVVGLARARDFALAHPGARVLVVALELCSLTFQHGDVTRRNIVAASLFADGAAAALVTGAEVAIEPNGQRPLELLAARSTLLDDSLDVMGWEVDEHGLHVVFSRDIPTIVRDWVRPVVTGFLADHGLSVAQLNHLVAHPGGPKVIAAYAEALGLPAAAFRHASEVLRTCGNMSSPTCLFVLERALAAGEIAAGDTALIAALGPGFASELVLARGAATPVA
jgi:alkylresorcinol/alkylpyrone synthase